MFLCCPQVEYEVADISGGEISAIAADGSERTFMLPNTDYGAKLLEEFRANQEKGGDLFWVITVLYCPRMVGKKWMANIFVESYKLGAKEQ